MAAGPYAGLIDRLARDDRVINAARVARTFGLDPLVVLAGTPERATATRPKWAWVIRVASHNIIADEESEQKKDTFGPDGIA